MRAALLLLLLSPVAVQARAVVLDALVARVDGTALTWSQVLQEVEVRRLTGEPPSLQAPEVVREGLVRRWLLLAEAEKLRLSATPAEVDAALADLVARCGGPERFSVLVRERGATEARIRERVRRVLLVEKYLDLRRQMTFVAEAEVQRFYREQKGVFGRDRSLAEVHDQVREYLARKKYQRELDAWIEEQVEAGRVVLLPLPGQGEQPPD